MAFACVKSVPRSPADFRAYAAMLGFGYDSDGKRVIGVKASELMETTVDKAEDRIKVVFSRLKPCVKDHTCTQIQRQMLGSFLAW